MISHFFIDRPIFAAVLSIAIVLAGALAKGVLPVGKPNTSPGFARIALAMSSAAVWLSV